MSGWQRGGQKFSGMPARDTPSANFVKSSKVWATPLLDIFFDAAEGGSHDGRYVAPRFSRVQGAI